MVPICPLEPPFQSSARTAVESMNKRLISRLMHARVSGLRSCGVYFFRGAFEYVLRGIVLDYTPRGVYISDFRFPLFDFAGPNLLYSDRLPERPYIEKGEMSEEAIVDFVMASPEARDAFGTDTPMGLEEFVQHLLQSDCLLNPHARLIHAAAMVLLGEESNAAKLLDELPPILHPKDLPRCHLLREKLRQGPEAARMLLDQVRQENLQAFGVV